MKRNLLLLLLCFSVFFACRGTNPPNQQIDLSLQELKIDGVSILDKLDDRNYYDFKTVKKYSVAILAKTKSSGVVVTVGTEHSQSTGYGSSFTCHLRDGDNLVKVVTTYKLDKSQKKVYTIKIHKDASGLQDSESSKLKELKVDGDDVLNKLDSNNVYNLGEVEKTKTSALIYVLPHNANAEVDVSNDDNQVSKTGSHEYKVELGYGLNKIKVLVSSDGEGTKLHTIKIYKAEELGLKSFKVDDKEYCDANTGTISQGFIRFPQDKESVRVSVETKAEETSLVFKCNGKEVQANGGVYNLILETGNNRVVLVVMGNGGSEYSRSHEVILFRTPANVNASGLEILKADDVDVLPLLSDDNTVTLPSVHNEKNSIQIEAKRSGATVKCEIDNTEVPLSGSVYNVSLKEGNNTIKIKLIEGSSSVATYTIFITRYPKWEDPTAPQSDELTVEVIVSDGVNGSPVDGTYLNVYKTKETTALKRLLVKNGKARVTLKKDVFYDFKLEGRNDEFAVSRYAASDIISYYVDESRKIIPMVQPLLARVNRPAIAPVIEEFKFDDNVIEQGVATSASGNMKNVSIKLLTSSTILDKRENKLSGGYPLPMLAVGFVPTTSSNEKDAVILATNDSEPTKNSSGKYNSSWSWSPRAGFIKDDTFDVVVVAYDIAANRVEYHVRFKTTETVEEDATIKVENVKISFDRQPTRSSSLYSVGHDAQTGNSTHYTNVLSFDVKRSGTHPKCSGFDLYRKCVDDNEEYRVVKHFVYSTATDSLYRAHKIADTDGLLEDEKTYKYKIIAFTEDGKKSALASSDEIAVTVPKSTVVLLTFPYDVAISKSEAREFDYKFKFSNPKILKNAKLIKMGLLISDKQGTVFYASKFRYVFSESGKPKLYFAERGDAIVSGYFYLGTNYSIDVSTKTSKSLDQLIKVDRDNGTVTIKKDLVSLNFANIARYKSTVSYIPGEAYYWDIVDFGTSEYQDWDDLPCVIEFEEKDGVTLTVPCNNYEHGNNAWNGRGEFTVRWD